MVLLEKDCIIYKPSKELPLNSYEVQNKYEKLEIDNFNSSVLKITYRWIDPIRIREKIIARDESSLTLVYIKKTKVIACFGSSESFISYAVSRIESIFDLKLSKLEIFNNHAYTVLADLYNIHLYSKSSTYLTDYEDTNNGIIKLNVKEVPAGLISSYFTNEIVTLLSFKFLDINNKVNYFYIDKGSVVTFPDLMKEDVIYYVLEEYFYFS